MVIGLVVLIALSTVYFHLGGRDWLNSLYLALTASTSTGDGDLTGLSTAFRFGAVIIQLFGLVLSAGITAVIVDALISARLAAITGGVRGKPRHHVVVCGLGRMGTAVAARLKARGIPVVAIEQREEARRGAALPAAEDPGGDRAGQRRRRPRRSPASPAPTRCSR